MLAWEPPKSACPSCAPDRSCSASALSVMRRAATSPSTTIRASKSESSLASYVTSIDPEHTSYGWIPHRPSELDHGSASSMETSPV